MFNLNIYNRNWFFVLHLKPTWKLILIFDIKFTKNYSVFFKNKYIFGEKKLSANYTYNINKND